ncbi:MAG: hypothetical protein LBR98_04050 [Syntrophomonadaceae bacterium]|jgi:hypothetical protein|nr:hypothetical protein [Syntrophomonadaceae bacterium]
MKMILVIRNWRRKITAGFIVLALLTVCGMAAPKIMGFGDRPAPVINTWLKDEENPRGNPMRVENNDAPQSKFARALDNFVTVIQGFYNQE